MSRSWSLRFFFLALFSGCALFKPIPKYDPGTVDALVGLYAETDDFMDHLMDSVGTPGSGYLRNKPAYKAIGQHLKHLRFRVNAIPHNERSDSLLQKIHAVVIGQGVCDTIATSLQDVHACDLEGEPLTREVLESRRESVTRTFRAALIYENEKKRLK